MQATTKAAAKSYEDAFEMTKEQVNKASENFFRGYDDMATFGKDTVEAMFASSTLFAKGFEAMGREWMGYCQTSLDSNVDIAKQALACKTLQDVVDLQSGYAKTSFDKLMTEGTKLSEMGMKVASEATQPLQARVNRAAELFMKPLSA
jgi:phasin family protein